jgi:hypothetical protein
MSAFICSDKHFAVVAKALFASPTQAQQFADALKRENIKSVNHRYNESYRFRKVKLDAKATSLPTSGNTTAVTSSCCSTASTTSHASTLTTTAHAPS